MRKYVLMVPFILLFVVGSTGEAANDDLNSRIDKSRNIVLEYMKALKGELKKALNQGGTVNAIKACNLKAPEITKEISLKHGMTVGRTSLKVRNKNNTPDVWEKKVLESFEKQKTSGKDVRTLEYSEIVSSNGKKVFRYMKAIPTNAICLRCHGTKLGISIQEILKEHYPDDMATGFKAGDIRGAFTITRPIE